MMEVFNIASNIYHHKVVNFSCIHTIQSLVVQSEQRFINLFVIICHNLCSIRIFINWKLQPQDVVEAASFNVLKTDWMSIGACKLSIFNAIVIYLTSYFPA